MAGPRATILRETPLYSAATDTSVAERSIGCRRGANW